MSDIGVIGLGVMGKNLILNMIDNGYTVHVFNRTLSKVQEVQKLSERIQGFDTLEDFVKSLKSPRKILLMVTAGDAVDQYTAHLNDILDNADIVIDGGNSDYKDTIRRSKELKYNFVGCGISGGEQGARNGPSMMIGCKEDVYMHIGKLFEDISAKSNDGPCCGWMGKDGAGHFVKIVHNGIEYCEMQLLQELVYLAGSGVNEIFSYLEAGRCTGYLVEICNKILKKKNETGNVLEQILDRAQQKGTGKLFVRSGLENDVDVRFVATSVFSRYLSNEKDRRVQFYEKAVNALQRPTSTPKRTILGKEVLEKAFYLCKMLCFIQGFDFLSLAKSIYGWEYTVSKICQVWKDGCIIRSSVLDVLKEVPDSSSMELSTIFIKTLEECFSSLKDVVIYSTENNIYCPLFSDCLMYINGLALEKGNGTLIQAMRDYFGKHGVEMEGEEGTINIDWES